MKVPTPARREQPQRTGKSWVAVFPFRRVKAGGKPIIPISKLARSRKGNTATQLVADL